MSCSYGSALVVAVTYARRAGFSLEALFVPQGEDVRALLAFPGEIVGWGKLVLARST